MTKMNFTDLTTLNDHQLENERKNYVEIEKVARDRVAECELHRIWRHQARITALTVELELHKEAIGELAENIRQLKLETPN